MAKKGFKESPPTLCGTKINVVDEQCKSSVPSKVQDSQLTANFLRNARVIIGVRPSPASFGVSFQIGVPPGLRSTLTFFRRFANGNSFSALSLHARKNRCKRNVLFANRVPRFLGAQNKKKCDKLCTQKYTSVIIQHPFDQCDSSLQ